MAKVKAYRVLRSFPALHKETGQPVHITRENEHEIPNLLTASAIKAHVESGGLAEDTVDDEGQRASDVVTADATTPTTGKTKGR